MICSKCHCNMQIVGGKDVVYNGNTPDAPTRLVRRLTFKCTNPKCPESNRDGTVQELEQEITEE